MQHVVQQWWCDVRGLSPEQSPLSHSAHPTHGSPSESGSAANPVDANTRTTRAESASSAIVRSPGLKRVRLTVEIIGAGAQCALGFHPFPLRTKKLRLP